MPVPTYAISPPYGGSGATLAERTFKPVVAPEQLVDGVKAASTFERVFYAAPTPDSIAPIAKTVGFLG